MRAGATSGFATGRVRAVVALTAKGLCFSLLAASFAPHQAAAAEDAARLSEPGRPLSAQQGAAAPPTTETRPAEAAAPPIIENRPAAAPVPNNVPAKFFDNVVRAAFAGTNGIVYVLPETKSARVVFASYDVDELARLQIAGEPRTAQADSAAARD